MESEVYIRRFPSGESQARVSSDGGYGPPWAPDSGELDYRTKEAILGDLDFFYLKALQT